MTDCTTLARIASYPDRLVTPFDWQAVAEKMADMASHAVGWRVGREPLPELKHAPTALDDV